MSRIEINKTCKNCKNDYTNIENAINTKIC